MFTTRHGTPIEPRNFNRSFSRCVAAAKVPMITVHVPEDLWLIAGRPRRTPARSDAILQHSKIAVTMEIYIEVPSAAAWEALGKLGQWLDSDS